MAQIKPRKIIIRKPAKVSKAPSKDTKTVEVTIIHEIKASNAEHAKAVKSQLLHSVKHAKFSALKVGRGYVSFLVKTEYTKKAQKSDSNAAIEKYIRANSPGIKSVKVVTVA